MAWPLAVRAQRKAMPVIGYLYFASPNYIPAPESFLQGLREYGYIDGRNFVRIDDWANTWLGGQTEEHSLIVSAMFSPDNSLSDIRNYIKERTGVDPKKKIQMRARAHSRG